MNKQVWIIVGFLVSFALGFALNSILSTNRVKHLKGQQENITGYIQTQTQTTMKLGAFSMSLSVKNLDISKEFYEKLGFSVFAGSMEQNYLIMKNGNALIGLFQGMFEGNILTFNPGWDENAGNTEDFEDIRSLQKQLKNSGLTLMSEADESTEGPASLMLTDPDGNVILLDQHR